MNKSRYSLLVFRILSFCRFLFKNLTGISRKERSAFASYFIREILFDKHHYTAYDQLKALSAQLKHDGQRLRITDFGAGGQKQFTRRVKAVYRRSVITRQYGQLLFRIAKAFDVKHILELGTSLGLSSAYLAMGKPKASVLTIEGCPELAAFARGLHKDAGIQNIRVLHAAFDDELEAVLKGNGPFQLFYVDGNHTYEASKRYITLIQQYSSSQIVLILDDIHWSKGMEKVWLETVKAPEIRLSIDLYRMGILILNTDLPKEHFHILF